MRRMVRKEGAFGIGAELIEIANRELRPRLELDLKALEGSLARSGVSGAIGRTLENLVGKIASFEVSLPSWGLGTGGTRFARFPGAGEPMSVFEKLEDAAVVQELSRGAGSVSLHMPWDAADPQALREHARRLGLRFDAMNSNTFQDQSGQRLSYKHGSLSHPDLAIRKQAIEHNLSVIRLGKELGSRALTVWLSDGSDAPGQSSFQRSLDRTVSSLREIYSALPADWRLLLEYKPYEPAFYSTVIQDWGTALLVCQALGERAQVLVDLGHHLPGTNIEQIVSRLIGLGRLGGFHLNDSKYGDDDLTAASIKPYQLFLIFCELVEAEREAQKSTRPFGLAYMIDQSHNTKDPVEALILTVEEARRAYAKALLVDCDRLHALQDACDPVLAECALKNAFETDVRPLLAAARLERGGAIDPIGVFRASGYRAERARVRNADRKTGGGIV